MKFGQFLITENIIKRCDELPAEYRACKNNFHARITAHTLFVLRMSGTRANCEDWECKHPLDNLSYCRIHHLKNSGHIPADKIKKCIIRILFFLIEGVLQYFFRLMSIDKESFECYWCSIF